MHSSLQIEGVSSGAHTAIVYFLPPPYPLLGAHRAANLFFKSRASNIGLVQVSLLSATLSAAMGCAPSKQVRSNESRPEGVQWDGIIRPTRPWKVEPALTSQQLERLRNEFWETRVEGRKEMWEALRFAAEAESVCHLPISACAQHVCVYTYFSHVSY